MVEQLHDLMDALQAREHRLMGNYTSSAQLIPQVIWAFTLTARDFFGQVCTCNHLEPTTGTSQTAKATLNTYTHMITMKMRLDLDGLPTQWTPQALRTQVKEDTNITKPTAPNKTPAHHSQPKQHRTTTPSRPTENPNWPPIFANNKTIKQLLMKRGRILGQLFTEAGIQGGGDRLDITGLPDNICLRWLILGKCGGGRGQECN